jgi:hypothetical protein
MFEISRHHAVNIWDFDDESRARRTKSLGDPVQNEGNNIDALRSGAAEI